MTKLTAVSLAALVSAGCFEVALPTSLDDPESFCSSLSPTMFYCQTAIQPSNTRPLPDGWMGYCSPANYTGTVGYSAIVNGVAFNVMPSPRDFDAVCNAPGASCSSIVRCMRH
jgi:hypothetical protein